MSHSAAPADFALDLLRDLSTGHYRPAAWADFFARSWQRSRRAAREHPQLVASWRRVALGLALVEAAALAGEVLVGGSRERVTAVRALPGAAVCLAYTLGDAYVHLGMNQWEREAPLYETLGAATTLTLARGAASGFLLGHLLGGRPAARGVAIGALAIAVATDIADGALARARRRTTRLGTYLDSEVDFGFGVVLSLTLVARGMLPRWLVALLLARWMSPLAYVLASYFGGMRRVTIDSTATGTVAGVAQVATACAALLPERTCSGISGLRRALHLATAALLIVAPLTQLVRSRHMLSGGSSGFGSSARAR